MPPLLGVVMTNSKNFRKPKSFPQIRLENVERSTKNSRTMVREFYQFYLQPKAD